MFLLGGKDEISRGLKGKNFGVSCPGWVEAVAHSLRDTLQKHRKSGFALLKIDFKNVFNLLNREAFVRATSKMFPGLERWTWWCYNQPPLLVYDHKREFFSQEFSKGTRWVPCTSAVGSSPSLIKFRSFGLCNSNGIGTMV